MSKTAFVFDRDMELGRLEGALNRDMTLVEFPVVVESDERWVPYSRTVRKGDPLGEAAHVVMEHDGTEEVRIETRTMNVSDFYVEVIDRDWAA